MRVEHWLLSLLALPSACCGLASSVTRLVGCISAPDLARIGAELMKERYAPMRKMIASFGARAYNLSEGLGTFIVEDKEICPQKLYGHQGLAYGAVHGIFYDPAAQKGVVILTSGCSEARNGVLADINKAIMKKVFR